MTVAELIEDLSNLPGEWLVVLAKDAEGNSFSPLTTTWSYLYEASNTWSGEVIDPDDPDTEASDDAVPAIVLWPTN